MQRSAAYWIKCLELEQHPEGGYYKEVYRSLESIPRNVLPGTFKGDRSYCTSIYFLLQSGEYSVFHRIASDEIWYFHDGSPLTVFMIESADELSELKLGNDPEKGEVFQGVVPAGHWFGSKVGKRDSYALVSCTVAPGFDFEEFEMAERNALIREFSTSQRDHS